MVTISSISFNQDNICVKMSDGEVIETSIKLFPNLRKGTTEQILNFEIKGGGRWVHWEELDEDLSAEGFLKMH